MVALDATANKVFNQQRQNEKPRIWCDFCNKPRHTRDNCWKIHGKPANWKSNKPSDKPNQATSYAHEVEKSPFSKEQMDHLLELLKSNSLSSTPCGALAQIGSNPNALSCSLNPAPWIIDSRASDHMTSFFSLFSNYSRCYKNERVRIADGSFSPIVGKCQIEISNQITLQFVIHVPKLACNLLFVSKISKDSNCRAVFLDSHCEFQDRNSGKMIGSAKMVHGLLLFC